MEKFKAIEGSKWFVKTEDDVVADSQKGKRKRKKAAVKVGVVTPEVTSVTDQPMYFATYGKDDEETESDTDLNKSVFADPRAIVDLRKEQKRKKIEEESDKTFVPEVVKEKKKRRGK